MLGVEIAGSLLRLASFVAGLGLVLGTWSSVTRTLVVPRGLTSMLTAGVNRGMGALFRFVAGRFTGYEARDRVLVALGPVTLIAQLFAWMLLFYAGFLLMLLALSDISVFDAFREVGSSMFTLGYAVTPRLGPVVVSFLAAATGLIIVALEIAYLPTLYSAFNRREMLVTLLQSRAGSPAWGPELLARHQLVDIIDDLPGFYGEWERWAAEVAETHSNYPVLVYFRSPDPMRSWVVALIAVLDSAALYLSLSPDRAPSQARLCLRMGFTSLREIARAIGLPFDADPRPDAPIDVTYDDFLAGVRRLEKAGFPMERTAEEAWPHFHGWRVNYEPVAYAIASAIDAVPAVWTGPRRYDVRPVGPIRPPDRRPEAPDVDRSKLS